MKNKIFVIPVLVLSTWISSLAKADTVLDGLWGLDQNSVVTCSNNSKVDPAARAAFMKKYKNYELYLSALSGWTHWLTEHGEMVTVPFYLEPGPSDSAKKFQMEFVIKHPGTTLADIKLTLLDKAPFTKMEYRSTDTEFKMCLPGGEFKVTFNYLRFRL